MDMAQWFRDGGLTAYGEGASHSNRRIRLRNATPAWADLDAIATIYRCARQLSDRLGVKLHVDHVIPLQGRLVSGLHVPDNLAIVHASSNLVKRNRYTP